MHSKNVKQIPPIQLPFQLVVLTHVSLSHGWRMTQRDGKKQGEILTTLRPRGNLTGFRLIKEAREKRFFN
jgi:hypothetical protein